MDMKVKDLLRAFEGVDGDAYLWAQIGDMQCQPIDKVSLNIKNEIVHGIESSWLDHRVIMYLEKEVPSWERK